MDSYTTSCSSRSVKTGLPVIISETCLKSCLLGAALPPKRDAGRLAQPPYQDAYSTLTTSLSSSAAWHLSHCLSSRISARGSSWPFVPQTRQSSLAEEGGNSYSRITPVSSGEDSLKTSLRRTRELFQDRTSSSDGLLRNHWR